MKYFVFLVIGVFVLQIALSSAQDDTLDADIEGVIVKSAKPAYLTSNTLTEITIEREATGPYNTKTLTGTREENLVFKITGYLKEIDPQSNDLTSYADRAFEFENGKVEWTINQDSNDGGKDCTRIVDVSGSGKDDISKLNVFYEITDGQSTSISGKPLSSSGKFALKYNRESLSGKPELILVGQVLIPFDITETVEVHQTSPNVKQLCNGATETTSSVRKRSATVKIPLTLSNLDLIGHEYIGSSILKETFGGMGEDQNAETSLGYGVFVGQSSFPSFDSPWKVSWNLQMPFLDTEKDSDKDGLSDVRESSFKTDPKNPDTDNDGLLDGWEALGVFKTGKKVVDLPSMGADPLVQDIFLELDWMQDGVHSHKPSNDVIQRVVNAFARKNIQLHVDVGQFGGGNQLTEQTGSEWHKSYLNSTQQAAYEPNNQYLFDIKKNNFDPNRLGIFYYGMFAHEKSGSSGQAAIGGNFYVALWWNSSVTFKSGTLMHEFGHTLQLGHGGRQNKELRYDSTHFKPNYRSIMNYHFQLNGVPRYNESGDIVYDLNYADEEIADLDENNLDENSGMSASNSDFLSYYTCQDKGHGVAAPDVIDNQTNNLFVLVQLNSSSIDWDCDGAISGNVATNINGNGKDEYDTTGGTNDVLVGRKDWDKIVLKIGCPNYGLGDDFVAENIISVSNESNNCPEHDDIRDSLGVELESDDRFPPIIPFIGEACDGEDNDGDGKVDEGCTDTDNDGVVDDLDNCIYTHNPDQTDSNKDFVGDACVGKSIAKLNSNLGTEDKTKEKETTIDKNKEKEIIDSVVKDWEAEESEFQTSILFVVIVIVIIAVLGAVGYFVYTKKMIK